MYLKAFIGALIGSSVAYFGLFTIRLYFKKKKYAHIPGPDTKGLFQFYFGNLIDALNQIDDGVMFPIYIQNCFDKYGPIFKIQLFDRIVIYTIDPDMVKKGLIIKNFSKYSKIYKSVGFPYNVRFLGHGLVTETNTEIWKHRRALFQPGFNKKVLMNYTNEFDSKADRLIQRLRNLSLDDKLIDLKNELSHTVLEIIAEVAFGMSLDCLNDSQNEFNKNVQEALEGINEIFRDPLVQFIPNKRFKKASKFLRQIGKEQILKRINALKNNEYVPNDILSIVLATHYNESFEMENMIDDFVTFFIAGLETTSNSLSFCFLELGRNQNVLKKLKDEINQVIGLNQKITYEMLEKLNYTSCVFKETLRLWPIVPSINRLIGEEIYINGFKIPKNTEISFSTYCAHRNPKYYPNSDEFIPERFLIDPITNKNSIHPYTYFPFSLGPRNCLGQNFAMIEAKMIIAKIIQNFEIQLDNKQDINVEYVVNLTLKNNILYKLRLIN